MIYRVYKNINTGKEVYILKKNKKYVHVEYINSNMRCWYLKGDFQRLFKLRP
jgi:uncharacterized protein YgiM (DUF1202 family)